MALVVAIVWLLLCWPLVAVARVSDWLAEGEV
jgi:hypothetical protein